jgi:small-conductance mechanosensitive channel
MPNFENSTLSELHSTLAGATLQIGNVTLNPLAMVKAVTVILVLLWLVGMFVRLLDRRMRRIKGMRASNRALILKLLQVMLYCVVFLVGMQMMGINLTALSVFGGALGVGLGFGLQKIASNFISGIILLSEKSIEVNDVIELADGTIGTIKRTGGRYTLLEAQDGREVMIPNEEFISQRVISWTHTDKNARVELAVTVAYDSDIEMARKIMLDAANNHPKRVKTRPSMCVLHAFRDSGIEIHLYFWIADIIDGRMEPKSEVMTTMLAGFRRAGITIPYPQRELRVTNVTPADVVSAGGGV